MTLKIELKLFKVTKVEGGYNWSNEVWTNYYLAPDKDTIEEYIRQEYGEFDKYYYDEEEHISIEEVEITSEQVIGHSRTHHHEVGRLAGTCRLRS